MARFLHRNLSQVLRKWATPVLALSWGSGLLSGVALFHDAGTYLFSLMPMAAVSHVSIVGLLSSAFLPFLISAFAVYTSYPLLLAVVSFFKAFCFSFVSCGAFAVFGSGSWLVWLLLMAHDIASSVLLYLYCQRHMSGIRPFSWVEIGTTAAVYLLLTGLEYWIFSPFLLELI